MLTIIILNYKGWEDTLACLESLRSQSYPKIRVVVTDNGSMDESLIQFTNWQKNNAVPCTMLKEGETTNIETWLYLLPLKENYGFAIGNNKAIQAMSALYSDYILCLNNDTIVEKDSIFKLIDYADKHPEVGALTPAIRLFSQPNIMWNAGGRLTFGGRRYYCCMKPASQLEGKHVLDITFVTGCALMIRPELLEDGKLFTERFFFGEEDYEFSLRMQQTHVQIVCLLDALIYHKVSASTRKFKSYNKLFIYVLNRAIDLRLHYSNCKYILWKILFYTYLRCRFLRQMTWTERNAFVKLLKNEIAINDGVSHELYDKYINYPFTHE